MEEVVFDISKCKDDYIKAMTLMYIVTLVGISECESDDYNPDKIHVTNIFYPYIAKVVTRYPDVTYEKVDSYNHRYKQKLYKRIEDGSYGGLGYSVTDLKTLKVVADFVDADEAYDYANRGSSLWVNADSLYVNHSMTPLRSIDDEYKPKHMDNKGDNNGMA